jgi:hypothetical protein
MAGTYGISRTANTLRVNYSALISKALRRPIWPR